MVTVQVVRNSNLESSFVTMLQTTDQRAAENPGVFKKKFDDDGVKGILMKRLGDHWLRDTHLAHVNIALVRGGAG